MQYKYVTEQLDYSDFSSGRVFYSLSGHPAFPVRLASEIFQRCLAAREKIYNTSTPCTLYDPCCGAAYHLSILAYLHRQHFQEIIGSDIDEKAIALAGKNLGLLTMEGLEKRICEISTMFDLYKKDSHRDALASAEFLKNKLTTFAQVPPVLTKVFQANAADTQTIVNHIKNKSVDIVFTDIPYGQHSHWHNNNSSMEKDPVWSMLNSLVDILSAASIVAIVSDKHQKVSHKNFDRVDHFQIGKRKVVILKPA